MSRSHTHMGKNKMVMLDSWCANSGDLSWDSYESLGAFTHYPRTTPAQVVERCAGANIVLTNKVILDAEVIGQLPELEYIGVMATGYNVVDIEAAQGRGIVVTNVPAYSTASVAQMVFALLLHHTQQVALHNDMVQRGDWCTCVDFSFQAAPLQELSGKTFGIVGFGSIGQAVAVIARAFGMQVLVHTSSPARHPILSDPASGYKYADLDELLRCAHVLSLHCPLTERTEKLIDAAALERMRTDAILINTGRGPLLDEEAVAAALHAGRLGAMLVDVLSTEPPSPDNPLLQAPNCVITPHIAWATDAARQRLLDSVSGNIAAFQHGAPVNVVS